MKIKLCLLVLLCALRAAALVDCSVAETELVYPRIQEALKKYQDLAARPRDPNKWFQGKSNLALKWLCQENLGAADKAALWQVFAHSMHKVNPDYHSFSGRAADGAYLFWGAAWEMLIISPDGKLYLTKVPERDDDAWTSNYYPDYSRKDLLTKAGQEAKLKVLEAPDH